MSTRKLSPKEEEAKAAQQKLMIWGGVGAGALVLVLAIGIFWLFFAGGSRTGTSDAPAKLRLQRLMELYQVYANEHNGKPPRDEQALKDFAKKLSKQKRDDMNLGDDLDGLFVSPRDGQKYRLPYNVTFDVSGETHGVAWEATGQGGKRFVYLNMGYVEEYPEDAFKQLKKK